MEEETINYQGKFVPFTKAKFEAKERLISNKLLNDNSIYLGGIFNYANPIIDMYNKYWMVINNEILQYFTQTELNKAIDYNLIDLPKIKI
jgi:hypothetical protein